MTENWCKTVTNVAKSDFSWTLANFTFFCESVSSFYSYTCTHQLIESEEFFSKENSDIKWRLLLHPGGRGSTRPYQWRDARLYAIFTGGDNNIIKARFHVFIGKVNNEELLEMDVGVQTFGREESKYLMSLVAQDTLYTITESGGVRSCLPKDVLKINCYVEATINIEKKTGQRLQKFKLENRLPKRLVDFFESNVLIDITFVLANKELKAHKVILASRSGVFRAMFEIEMTEKKENRVEIVGIEPNIFQEMLRFIYTGEISEEVEQDYNTICDLLVAADRYDLPDLKEICERLLFKILTVENAAQILELSFKLPELDSLREVVMDFVRDNVEAVKLTEGWRELQALKERHVRKIFSKLSI